MSVRIKIEALTLKNFSAMSLHTHTMNRPICRLAVDMDIIHGYIHVWISDLGSAVDISMDMRYEYLIGNIINSI